MFYFFVCFCEKFQDEDMEQYFEIRGASVYIQKALDYEAMRQITLNITALVQVGVCTFFLSLAITTP